MFWDFRQNGARVHFLDEIRQNGKRQNALAPLFLLLMCRYDIMQKCWQVNADEQPPFSTLVVLVSTDLERQAGYLDFSCSADGFIAIDGKEKFLTVPSPTLPPPPLIMVSQPEYDVEKP